MLTLFPKPGVELLAILIPWDATEIEISGGSQMCALTYTSIPNDGENEPIESHEVIGAGDYTFITTTKNITEEQSAQLIGEKDGDGLYTCGLVKTSSARFVIEYMFFAQGRILDCDNFALCLKK